MANIAKITLPNNITYGLKDKNARNFTNTPYYKQDEEALMFQLGESYMTEEQDNQPYLFRAAGGSANIGNRQYDKIIGGTVAWNQLTPDIEAENTVTGDIVSIEDASAANVVSLRASFEPVQDLHGYEKPWMGGAGKNIFVLNATAQTINGVTFTPQADGTVKVNGTATADAVWYTSSESFTIPAGSYYLSGIPQGGTWTTFCLVWGSYANYSKSTPASMNLSQDISTRGYIKVGSGYTANNMIFKPMIRKSTDSATFEPYSNICPITGHTSAAITRVGKNLLPMTVDSIKAANGGASSWSGNSKTITGVTFTINTDSAGNVTGIKANGTASASTWLVLGSINDFAAGTYTLNGTPPTGTSSTYYLALTDSTIGFTSEYGSGVNIVKSASDTGRIGINIRTNYNANNLVFKPMVRFASDTDPTFEPYQGHVYNITFPTAAGTVYGGTLDLNAGRLVVDRAYTKVKNLTWSSQVSTYGTFYASVPDAYQNNEVVSVMSDCYAGYNNGTGQEGKSEYVNGMYIGLSGARPAVKVYDVQYPNTSDLENWKAARAECEIVYKLATPVTYSLTAEEITTLLGINHIWADAGSTTLTYISPNKHHTLTTGRKYLARISGADNVLTGTGQEVVTACGTDNLFDLTQMWGTSIADYIASTGGAVWFRKLFPKQYYEYNAGELLSVSGLQSHNMTGFNQWDEEWETGTLTSGVPQPSTRNMRMKNFNKILPNTQYCATFSAGIMYLAEYDENKNFLGYNPSNAGFITSPYVFTTRSETCYFKFVMSSSYGATYKNDICINLHLDSEHDGEYEEYKLHSYSLDSSLTLCGIPKLDANNHLYYDGDVYEADGTVTRKYEIVDLGTLTWMYVTDSATARGSYFYATIPSRLAGINFICSHYNNIGVRGNSYKGYNKIIAAESMDNTYIDIVDTAYTDAAALKAAMSGVYLVYELANPTTETAEPYDNPQIVAPEGTEEYITTSIVPVGHETRY